MKKLLLLFILSALSAHAQSTVKRDNGEVRNYYIQAFANDFEESVLLQPDGPCRITKVLVYLGGVSKSMTDTIRITGDPAEGTIAPTQFVWSYNTLAALPVAYSGKAGWYTIDVSDKNLRSDGYDRICIQHTNIPSGPRFAMDSDSASEPMSSFLYDPKGKQLYGTAGDFMVRLEVVYDFPQGETSEKSPFPSLLDVTKGENLVGTDGQPIKSARVSVADWNNDGFDDIAIGSQFFENQHPGTFNNENVRGYFKNVSSKVNIDASATVWGDYNNDGWLDAYAVNSSGDKIFKNNGDGTFTDITEQTGFSNAMPTVTPIWLDYDRDGNLDIFIANGEKKVSGQDTYFPDQLWKNNGDGTFKNVTAASKINLGESVPQSCRAASACDFNNDGWVDIFVATAHFAVDKFFKNNGNGTFTEVARQMGVHGISTKLANSYGDGVSCDWGDFNNDGFMDLAVSNFDYSDEQGATSNPTLIFKNNGGKGFTEMREELGIKFFEMSSGIMWADLDLDGNLDLWHSQSADSPEGPNEPKRRSRVYINGGADSNYAFKDKTWEFGPEIHGAWTQARLDFDNDGDIDILAASPYDGVRLFRNDMERKGNWIGFKLGSDGNPGGGYTWLSKINNLYDVHISLYAGNKTFIKTIQSGGTGATATQNTNNLNFGIGKIDTLDSIIVTYKQKQYSLFKNKITVNWYYYLSEDTTGRITVSPYVTILTTPAQVYPRNKQKLSGTDVTLMLTNYGGRPEIAFDSTFTLPFNNYGSNELKNLPENTTLYWRARYSAADFRHSSWSSVWSFTTGTKTDVENADVQENTLLKEAVPNPVSNKSTISFTVEKAGEISLKIFDIAGSEIAVLAEGDFAPGNYSETWNAENIPSGTYYYVLKTAAGSVTKKIVVAK